MTAPAFAPAAVGRLRFRGGSDPPAAAARLARALGSVDWSIPGLPPAAVLCVRRLRARPAQPGAVEAALADAARGAARPARGFVPAVVAAVWFADAAEWLACLGRDSAAGELAGRWWWEAVRRRHPGGRAAARAWIDHPAAAPAAWVLLAGWGVAPAFAATLEPIEAAELTDGMAAAFGVPMADRAVPMADERGLVELVSEAAALPPGPVRAALTVGLLLGRAPHLARTADRLARLRAWAEGKADIPAKGIVQPAGSVEDGARPAPAADQPRRTGPPAEHGLPPARPVADRVEAKPGEWRGGGATPDGGAPPAVADEAIVVRTDEPPRSGTFAGRQEAAGPIARPQTSDRVGPGGPSIDSVSERIDTRYGGLFYLVNVTLSLGLYPDFTEPARPGIELPLWDWLALLGRRWIGDEFAADPLDGLLAARAGRPRAVPPGEGCPPPAGWRLPAGWRPWADDPDRATWPDLDAWLDWLAPVIAARLADALGVADAPGWLIRRPAAVLAGPVSVDIVLSLDDLPVEIRLAGLDRDPGWVPAAGATIRFHYEPRG